MDKDTYRHMQFEFECLDFYNMYSSDIFTVMSLIDNKLEFRYISNSVERIRGISVEKAMKESLVDVFSSKSYDIIFSSLMRTVQSLNITKEKEDLVKTFDVELKTYHENIPLIDCKMIVRTSASYGKINYITSIVQDISWISRNRKHMGVLEMAGKTCHEFSQPAQALSGYTQLLESELNKKKPNRDNIKKYLNVINQQNEKLSSLLVKTHDIITTAKYKRKKQDMFADHIRR